MSVAGSASLGRVVLTLETDAGPLRQGLADAKRLTAVEAAALQKILTIKIQADLSILNAQMQRARSLYLLQFQPTIDLTQFRAGLQAQEKAHADSIKRMQALSRTAGVTGPLPATSTQRATAGTTTQSQRGGNFVGGLVAGAGIATFESGLALLQRAAGLAKGSIVDYNTSLEESTDVIAAYQKTNAGLAAQLDAVAKDAGKPVFGVRALTEAVQGLQPVAKRSGESIQELLKLSEILASLNPKEGLSGAAFALGELASGDVTSIVERFNIPRRELQKLREQGIGDIAALQRVLADLGIGFDIVSSRADNFNTRLQAALEGGTAAVGKAFAPAFRETSDLLGDLVRYLNSPEVAKAGANFAAGLAGDLANLRQYLSRDDVQDQLRSILGGLKDTGLGAVELGKSLVSVLSPALAGTATVMKHVDSQAAQSAIVYAMTAAGLVKLYEGIKAIKAAGGIGAIFSGVNAGIAAPLVAAGLALVAINETAKTLTGSTMPELIASVVRYGDAWARGRSEAQKALDQVRSGQSTGPDELKALQDNLKRTEAIFHGLENYQATDPAEFLLIGPARFEAAANWANAKKALDVYMIGYRAYIRETNYDSTARGASERLDNSPGLTNGPAGSFTPSPSHPDRDQTFPIEHYAQAGKATLQAYLDGITDGDAAKAVDQAQTYLESRFADLFPDLTDEAKQQGLSQIAIIAASVGRDIQDSGAITVETVNRIREVFGEATPAVVSYLNELDKFVVVQRKAADAADDLKNAQDNLNRVTAEGNAAVAAETARVEAAQRAADAHQQASQDRVAELQRAQSSLGDEASEVARRYGDQLDILQEQRDEVARLTQAHQDDAQAQIDGLREVQAAKSQDEAVKGLEVKQRADLLALEERIRAARSKGTPAGEREARALEDQRGLVQARSNYALDLARQRAAVAGDKSDTAKAPIEAAAAAQATKDKAAADAIDGRIKGVQDEAAAVAKDYDARARAIQGQITAEQERGREIAKADQAAIVLAQARESIAKGIASVQKGLAQFIVDRATDAKKLADGELTTQQTLLGVLDQKNEKMAAYVKQWTDLFKAMTDANVDPAILNSIYGVGSGGGPPSSTQAGGGPKPLPTTYNPPPVAVPVGPDPNYDPDADPRNRGDSLLDYRPSAYTPPVAPSNAAYAAGRNVASVANLRTGDVTLSFPNMVVRETADIDGIIDRAAVKAAQLSSRGRLAAMREDADGGGSASNWTRG